MPIHAPVPACTFDALRVHQFIGNHASDSPAFQVFGRYISNAANPLAHRAEVMHHMASAGMGLSNVDMGLPPDYRPGVSDMLDAKLVEQYVEGA